jgi:methyl-accepting chemotaxis protein
MENLTQEQIAQSVSAAFDSVNLINEINMQDEKTQEDIDTIQRNVEHIRIMMGHEWFVTALTAEQTEQINVIIND